MIIFIHKHSTWLGASKSGLSALLQSLLSTLPSTNHPSHFWVPAHSEPSRLWPCLMPFCLPRMPFLLINLCFRRTHPLWKCIPQCPGVQFIPPSSLPLSPRFTLLVSGLALVRLLLCLPPVLQMGGSLKVLFLHGQLLLIIQMSAQMSPPQRGLP